MEKKDAIQLEKASVEEIIEIRDDIAKLIEKSKADGTKTLSILKILARKKIDRTILVESKIGKTMTKLTVMKKDNFSNPEDFDAIKKASEKLLANMKQIAKQER